MSYFTLQEAAERYDRFRPKVHDAVLKWLAPWTPEGGFGSAIDIACGTGDSTLPLLQISNRLIGVDASPAMLSQARGKGFEPRQASYDEIAEGNAFDLINCCMAFHWFDQDIAISSFKRISRPGAIWLIYNFAFAGHATSEAFNQWFFQHYLKQYPSPPRGKAAAVIPDNDSEIEILKADKGVIPLRFNREELIGYLTTQSNIEAAVRAGRKYETIEADLHTQLKQIDLDGDFNYAYTYGIYRYCVD